MGTHTVLKIAAALLVGTVHGQSGNRGSPHGHRSWIHWIRIPDLYSLWCRVSAAWHAYYAHFTAGMDLTHAARIRIEPVSKQSGPWIRILDPHQIRIQGPMWRAPSLKPQSKIWHTILQQL